MLLLGRFSYQLSISGPCISIVIASATPLNNFYQHTVLSSPIIYLYKVIVPSTWIKSLITFWYQLVLSLTVFCFPNKTLVSGIPISYSSKTTNFLYSWLKSYQLLLSAITVFLLNNSFSDCSLLVVFSAIFISCSQLLPTSISYSHQLLVTGSC